MTKSADDPKPAMASLAERLRQSGSRLLLLNPGHEPTPVPEDWSVHDLLDLIAPGGKLHICQEPGGSAIGELARRVGEPDGGPTLMAALAAGVYNLGQEPIADADEGFVELGGLWALVTPGGFLCIHSPRPGEPAGSGIDLRQRLIDWLESVPGGAVPGESAPSRPHGRL